MTPTRVLLGSDIDRKAGRTDRGRHNLGVARPEAPVLAGPPAMLSQHAQC